MDFTPRGRGRLGQGHHRCYPGEAAPWATCILEGAAWHCLEQHSPRGEKPSLTCMQHSCQRAICGCRTWGPRPTRSSRHRQGSVVGPAGFTVLTEGLPPGPSSLRHPLAGHSKATRTCEQLVAGPLDTLIGCEPGRGPAMSLTGTSDTRGGEVSGALEPGAPDRCLQDKERLWCIQPLCPEWPGGTCC